MDNPYDHIAEKWRSINRGFRQKKYVDLVLQGLQSESKILDLGCGTGIPIAQYLIKQGFRVVGVDSSEKMLEIAKQLVPKAELLHGDMVNIELKDQFSAVVAWDSIFHIKRVHHQAIFEKLHKLLEPDGKLLLSSGWAGEEGFTSEMFGHTFFYSGYEPEVTLDLLKEVGFEIDLWEVDDPSSKGHIAIVARRLP